MVHISLSAYQFDTMSRGRSEVPDTLPLTRIIVRMVGRFNNTIGRRYFILAAAFLTVMTVL
jgi:hypothetical protein